MKRLLFTLFILAFGFLNAQSIKVEIIINGKIFSENNNQLVSKGDSISIDKFQFYISNIQLISKKSTYKESNSYHLIDAFNPGSCSFKIGDSTVNYNQVAFTLGIDSATNYKGVHGGDLDPMKGMYWSWRTGYINCKIEGQSSKSANRKGKFSFHLGGFQGKEKNAQDILRSTDSQKTITIRIDLNEFFKKIDVANQKNIMMPGEEAVKLSKIIAQNLIVK